MVLVTTGSRCKLLSWNSTPTTSGRLGRGYTIVRRLFSGFPCSKRSSEHQATPPSLKSNEAKCLCQSTLSVPEQG